jgi:hypothetical protein
MSCGHRILILLHLATLAIRGTDWYHTTVAVETVLFKKFDMDGKVTVVFLVSLCYSVEFVTPSSLPISIVYTKPEDCTYVQSNFAYFFNATSQGCAPCAQNVEFQSTSPDGKQNQ